MMLLFGIKSYRSLLIKKVDDLLARNLPICNNLYIMEYSRTSEQQPCMGTNPLAFVESLTLFRSFFGLDEDLVDPEWKVT